MLDIKELLKMDLDQLLEIRNDVAFAIKQVSERQTKQLGVGARVKVDHRKTPGTWVISKINRKTVVCEQDGRRIKCSMNMLVAA